MDESLWRQPAVDDAGRPRPEVLAADELSLGRPRSNNAGSMSGYRISLNLRIPGWADKATIKVNGLAANAKTRPGSYAELRRVWKAGDTVELQLPMPVWLIEANPLVEETRNQVAIKRGPIVYCLESSDLPKDVRVSDVAIRADTKFSAQYDADLLNGVAVVEGQVVAKSSGDWEGKLYRTLGVGPERKMKARFIPYYAWANRGQSEMSVWLPVK